MKSEFFDIYNDSGDRIRGELTHPETLRELPVVIICHSFLAFKDWGFFPYVAESFVKNGYIALRFNFSHNGVVGDGNRIIEFDRFRENTYSKELEDLRGVIDAVWEGRVGGGIIDRAKIILLGHSRGGGISIIQASEDARVKVLISWSAIGKFDRWTEHQKKIWRERGYLPLSKDSDVSPLRHGIELLNDLEQNYKKFDLQKAAARISIPWLILHGSADVIVPPDEVKKLKWSSQSNPTELKLIEGVGHLYNADNRKKDNYKTLNMIIDITINWLKGITK